MKPIHIFEMSGCEYRFFPFRGSSINVVRVGMWNNKSLEIEFIALFIS